MNAWLGNYNGRILRCGSVDREIDQRMDMSALGASIGPLWNATTAIALSSGLVGSIIIWWRCPDARKTLRNTLALLVITLVAATITRGSESEGHLANAGLIHGFLVLVLGATVIRLIGLFFFRVILAVFRVHPPSILEEIVVVIAYFAWAMLQVGSAGVSLGEILTTSAIATAVLAFAMQDTLGNILGGLALQWDHSLKVGDWVRIGDVEGKIVDIKWRAISIETRNWETVIVPNGMMMQNQFMVLGERTGEPRKWRRWVWFSVDYSATPDRVIDLAEGAVRQADIEAVEREPAPSCVLMEIDGCVARYALRYWLSNLANDDPTDSKVRQHVYAALNRESVRLAMPKQHLYLTNRDETYVEQKRGEKLEHRLAAISTVDLFRSLAPDELNMLAHKMDYRPYAQGDMIFKQGDSDHRMYVIASGKAGIYVERDGEEDFFAFSLGAGEVLGESGLMTGEARLATAKAETAIECYVLGKTALAEVLLQRAEIVEEITETLARRNTALQNARAKASGQDGGPEKAHNVRELVEKVRNFIGLDHH